MSEPSSDLPDEIWAMIMEAMTWREYAAIGSTSHRMFEIAKRIRLLMKRRFAVPYQLDCVKGCPNGVCMCRTITFGCTVNRRPTGVILKKKRLALNAICQFKNGVPHGWVCFYSKDKCVYKDRYKYGVLDGECWRLRDGELIKCGHFENGTPIGCRPVFKKWGKLSYPLGTAIVRKFDFE